MRTPSIKSLSAVFSDPKTAKFILGLPGYALSLYPAGEKRIKECYNPPKWHDVRMHVLNSLDSGLFGLESIETTQGEYADYLNTGDTYAPTVIYWRGNYRVQSLGDFVETLERQGVRFP